MNEESTNSQTDTTETPQENIQPINSIPSEIGSNIKPSIRPTYMGPIEQETNQDQYLRKKMLSKIGLVIALCLMVYSFYQFTSPVDCTGFTCMSIGIMGFFSAIFSLMFLLSSIAISVTSSKSYNDTSRRSIGGIIIGIIITLLSILILAYTSSILGFLILGLLILYVGLNITFKALRISNKKRLTYLSIAVVLIGLIFLMLFATSHRYLL